MPSGAGKNNNHRTFTEDEIKRLKNELEYAFEVLRDQEDNLQELYDLEAATKVLASAIGARVHDVAETNEELYSKLREIRVILNSLSA